MTLEFRIIGPPALFRDGIPVRFHSAKALALLAFLVCMPTTLHSRDKLAELLWGDSPEAHARHSLRQALYSLRAALAGPAPGTLVDEAGAVRIQLGAGIRVDLHDFRRLLSSGPGDLETLRKAAKLYRGTLLEGLALPGCPGFEDWLELERRRLEEQATGLLATLVDSLVAEELYDEALEAGLRLLALDTLDEGTHCRLMRVYAASGDRAGLNRQYRWCREILLKEMGAEPSAATQRLYDGLFARLPQAIPSRGPTSAQLATRAWPFVGRQAELASLASHLEDALSGLPRLVLVYGEGGIGKTALVDQFQRRASVVHREVRWLRGASYAAESRALYAPWADALAPLNAPEWQPALSGLAQPWRDELARIVPGIPPRAAEIPETTVAESRLRLLQGVVQVLSHLAESVPLALIFDDLHWADESSLELLHYAARHLASRRVLIVGTYRAEVLPDNPHLQALLNSELHAALRVPPWDLRAVESLVSGLQAPPGLARRLYERSGGNPLVVCETLRMLLDSANLASIGEGERVPVSPRVQDLVRARTAALADVERRLLAAAVVISRPCDLDLLCRVAEEAEVSALAPLEHLLRRSLLIERNPEASEDSIDLAHEYMREGLYGQLARSERRVFHRRAAEALVAQHPRLPDGTIEEIAYHYEQAGDSQALRYLALAADRAQRLYAFGHAVALYTRSLAILKQESEQDSAARFDLLAAREAMLEAQGRRAEQAEDVRALLALGEAIGDGGRMALARIRQAGLFASTGRPAEARQAGERALAHYRAAGDRGGEAQVLRELGFLYWSHDDFAAALSCNREALRLHRMLGDITGEATALHNLAEIYRDLGSPRQAMVHYEEALNLEWAGQDHRRQGMTLYGMSHALRQLGDREAALAGYRRALSETGAANDRLMASRVHHAVGTLLLEDGQPGQAAEHMEQALAISREIGYGDGIAHGLASLASLRAEQADFQTARDLLAEAMTWFQLMEDAAGLQKARAGLDALSTSTPHPPQLPARASWVKSHVSLAEGKVYCEFESPMAMQRNARTGEGT